MKYGNFRWRTRRGLVQLPILLGLLVMAIAIPVATKLVQENQDSRGSAASCGASGTISQCGSKGGCATGYRCLPKGCSYDPACGGFVPTNTPKPNQCTNGYTRCNGIQLQKCQNGNWIMVENCAYGCSNGACKAAPTATRTPTNTPKPTATSTPKATNTPKPTITSTPTGCHSGVIGKCGSQGNCATGYRCIYGAGKFQCSYDPACGGFVPTNTPKPNQCTNGYTRCNGIQLQKCQNGNWIMVENCAYGCSNGTCQPAPTVTRTPPTNTPTPSCLKENSMYQEGKCCPGLIKVNTPYGAICGKQGSCQPGQSKCSDDKRFVLTCDTSGYFQQDKACDGGCENGKCKTVCTPGQRRCFNSATLEVCSDNGSAWVKQSCSYGCADNRCLEKPIPTPSSIPTAVSCVPGKKTCTGNKGLMICNSQGNGYDQFTCGIGCLWGICIGEQVAVEPVALTPNCVSGEYKCEASNGHYVEYKCNSGGYWDAVKQCDSGCFYGRCKNTDSEDCLKKNAAYQEGKCCPGLVRVTTPYGYVCGEPGGCTPGSKRCQDGSVWRCNNSGYFEKSQRCDFGCEGGECQLGCMPKSARCRDEKTLQVCADNGNAWVNRSCNYCHEGICYDSKEKALEVINFGGVDWDGENLPYCQNPSAETVGLNTCPQGFICGAQKVEDRNGLYYCEKKSIENSTVKVCSPNSSFCGQGGVLLQCSADGNRWSGAWQCPQPRPEKGNQYNYSCKQVTADRGECRPATPEEGRDAAVEITGLTAATVAGALGLPAVVTGGGLSSAMLVAQGASAAYSVGNAAYNCQYYSQLTQEQREACWRSGAYAVINTGSAMLGMAQFQGVNNATTVYGGLAVSAADLGMGTIDAVEVCQNSTNPTECYLAIASAGVNALGFAGDVANASNFYQQQQLQSRVEFLPFRSDVTYSIQKAPNSDGTFTIQYDQQGFNREYMSWLNEHSSAQRVQNVRVVNQPAHWNMYAMVDDPGLAALLEEVNEFNGFPSVQNAKHRIAQLATALYERNDDLIPDYNFRGGSNRPWNNQVPEALAGYVVNDRGTLVRYNNTFVRRNVGDFFVPSCPGNVCYQNVVATQFMAAAEGLPSRVLSIALDEAMGEGHAVLEYIQFDGFTGDPIHMISDPTWAGLTMEKNAWIEYLKSKGLGYRELTSEEIFTPIKAIHNYEDYVP